MAKIGEIFEGIWRNFDFVDPATLFAKFIIFFSQQARHPRGQLPHAHPPLRAERGFVSPLRRALPPIADGGARQGGAHRRRVPRVRRGGAEEQDGGTQGEDKIFF